MKIETFTTKDTINKAFMLSLKASFEKGLLEHKEFPSAVAKMSAVIASSSHLTNRHGIPVLK